MLWNCKDSLSGFVIRLSSFLLFTVKSASEEGQLYLTIPFTHNKMVEYLLKLGCIEEAEKILQTLIQVKDKLDPGYFLNLHKTTKLLNKDMSESDNRYYIEHGLEL